MLTIIWAAKFNQWNLSTIQSSNLFSEIIKYFPPHETAICQLASLTLPTFRYISNNKHNLNKLHSATKMVTYNFNHVFDMKSYPILEACKFNFCHSPFTIRTQRLANTLHIPFDLPGVKEMNIQILKMIYHSALEM